MIDWTSPQVITFVNFLGLGFLGLLAAAGQWFGRRKETAAPITKDVAIDSVTIADRVALENLASQLRRSNDAMRVHRDHDRAMLDELKEINEQSALTARLLKEHDMALMSELREMNRCNARIENNLGRVIDRMK